MYCSLHVALIFKGLAASGTMIQWFRRPHWPGHHAQTRFFRTFFFILKKLRLEILAEDEGGQRVCEVIPYQPDPLPIRQVTMESYLSSHIIH